jgi:hypothetical protein
MPSRLAHISGCVAWRAIIKRQVAHARAIKPYAMSDENLFIGQVLSNSTRNPVDEVS